MEINSSDQVNSQQPISHNSKTIWIGVVILMICVAVGSYIIGTKNAANTQINQPVAKMVSKVTQPSPNQIMTKDDIRRELIERCGDIPREKLNINTGHYTVVDGPYWSPDCRHLAWSVWNSGTVVINSDGSPGASVKGGAEEGIFLYADVTGKTTKLTMPSPYNNPVLQQWKDRNALILDYNTNTNKGRASFIFDITTNTVQAQ